MSLRRLKIGLAAFINSNANLSLKIMHIIYAQKNRFPTCMAHAIHTYASIGEMLEHGAMVSFFPGLAATGRLNEVEDMFTTLGFPAAYAHRATPVNARQKGLYSLGFNCHLAASMLKAKRGQSIVHASSVKEACAALRWRSYLPVRLPVSFEIHHLVSLTQEGSRADKFAALERKAFAGADLVVFISSELQKMAEDLHKQGRLPLARQSVVLPNGFNQNNIRPVPEEISNAGNGRALAYVGSLQPGKGLETLLEALSLLPPDFTLKIIGGHPAQDELRLKQQSHALGLERRTIFCGQMPQSAVFNALSGCDIFVIPLNTGSNFFSPIKVFEALGFGLPIACTPMPTLYEHLQDGENALFAAGQSAADLARTLETLGNDPALRLRLRQNNRALSAQHTNAGRVAKLLSTYADVLRVCS